MSGIRVPIDQLISQVADLMPGIDISQEVDKIIRYCFIFERKVGTANGSYEHKECVIDVDNFRAQLPRDFYKMNGVKTGKYSLARYNGSSFYMFNKNSPFLANREDWSTDATLLFPYCWGNASYNITGNFLDLSVNIPQVGISYMALPLDRNGLPTISELHVIGAAKYCRFELVAARYFAEKASRQVYMDAKEEWEQERREAQFKDDSITQDEMNYIGRIFSSAYHSPDPNEEGGWGALNNIG